MILSEPLKSLIVVPLVMILGSLPLIVAKVPPNHWYGFRTSKTKSSVEMWYRANKLGGKYFFIAGSIELIALAIISAIQLKPETAMESGLATVVVPLAVAIILWRWRLGGF